MILSEEKFESFIEDALPLMVEHNNEVNCYGFELDIDFLSYMNSDIKIYTIRDDGKLVAYCTFFIYNDTHHKSYRHASQDAFYVIPKYRRCGLKLLRYTEKKLKEHGISIVHQSVPAKNDWSLILRRRGYTKLETVYKKDL